MSVNEQSGHSSGSGHSSMHCKRPEAQSFYSSCLSMACDNGNGDMET